MTEDTRTLLKGAVTDIVTILGYTSTAAQPILDSRLPDGSRVAAVIPPCSLNGVVLTIRKFNARKTPRHGPRPLPHQEGEDTKRLSPVGPALIARPPTKKDKPAITNNVLLAPVSRDFIVDYSSCCRQFPGQLAINRHYAH